MVLALDILLHRAKQHAQHIKRAKRHALRQRSLTVTFDMPEWKKRNYPLVRASPRPRNPNATGYAKYRRGYDNSPWALEYLHDHLDPASLQGTEFRRKFQVPRCIFDGIVADTRNSGVLPDELIARPGELISALVTGALFSSVVDIIQEVVRSSVEWHHGLHLCSRHLIYTVGSNLHPRF